MTVITLVIAASLVFSGSVGGMSSALLGVVVWMTTPWVRRGARVGLVVVLAGALVAASTLGSATSSPRHRVVQVLSQSSANPLAGSGQSRIDVIKAAWPRIRSDPFVGTGLGDPNLGVTLIQNGFTHVEQVHNAPVATWYETGIVGLTGLLLIFGSVLRLGWSAVVAATTARARTLAWAVVCAYLTFIVFAMTAPLYFQNYGWFAGALIVAMSVEARAGLVRTVAPSGPASRAPVAPTIARVGATG
jgi:O-antigen ligase